MDLVVIIRKHVLEGKQSMFFLIICNYVEFDNIFVNFITLMYITAIMAMPGPVDPSVLILQATHRSVAA